jgi:Putative DNA-binding domain
MSALTTSRSRARSIDRQAWNFVDFLESEYPILRIYLGETHFFALAAQHVESHPAETLNARVLCRTLPEFLKTYSVFLHRMEIQELAELQLAMSNAFAAVDTVASTTGVTIHPSVSVLTFRQNALSIWSALKCESQPPRPHLLDDPQTVIVWRQGLAPRFRIMGGEEASVFDAASRGLSFMEVCKATCFEDTTLNKVQRCSSYFNEWSKAEILAFAPDFIARLEK